MAPTPAAALCVTGDAMAGPARAAPAGDGGLIRRIASRSFARASSTSTRTSSSGLVGPGAAPPRDGAVRPGAGRAARVMGEVSDVARALKMAFDARKINYALFGNVVPHMHWHLIPRLASDPPRTTRCSPSRTIRCVSRATSAPTESSGSVAVSAGDRAARLRAPAGGSGPARGCRAGGRVRRLAEACRDRAGVRLASDRARSRLAG
jgi:hypothetical protein